MSFSSPPAFFAVPCVSSPRIEATWTPKFFAVPQVDDTDVLRLQNKLILANAIVDTDLWPLAIPHVDLLANEQGRQLRVPLHELPSLVDEDDDKDNQIAEASNDDGEAREKRSFRRRLVTQIKDVQVVHQAWMLANNHLRLLGKKDALELIDLRVVPLATIIKDSHFLMLGLESESFVLHGRTKQLEITRGLCTDDLTPETVSSCCRRMIASGNTCRQLEAFLVASLLPSKTPSGLVAKAFLQAIQGYLTGYQRALMHVFSLPVVSLISLDKTLDKLHSQLNWLKSLILDSQVPKNNCDLLIHLQNSSISLHESHLVALTLYLLNTTLQPFFKCIEDWICGGIWHEELQHLGIFINPQHLQARHRVLWSHAFVIDKAFASIEKGMEENNTIFKRVQKSIFVCGKSMHLLKVCTNNHFLARLSLQKRLHFRLITTPTQVPDVQRECDDYYNVVNALSSLEIVTAKEKRMEEEQLRQEKIEAVKQKHEETLDRLKALRLEKLRAQAEKKRIFHEDLKEQMEAELKRKEEARMQEKLEDEKYAKMLLEDERREEEMKEELKELYSSLGAVEEMRELNYRRATHSRNNDFFITEVNTVEIKEGNQTQKEPIEIREPSNEDSRSMPDKRNESTRQTIPKERPKSLIESSSSDANKREEIRTVVGRKQKRSRPIEETLYRPTSMPIMDDEAPENEQIESKPVNFLRSDAERVSEYEKTFDLKKKGSETFFQSTKTRKDNDEGNAQVEALASMESLLEQSLIIPLKTQLRLVNEALLNHLLVDCQMEEHFKALKNYILFGDGLYCRQLCASMFSAMDECFDANQVVNPATLNRIVDAALQGSPFASTDGKAQNVGFTLVGVIDASPTSETEMSEAEDSSLKTNSSTLMAATKKNERFNRLEMIDKAILNCLRLGYRTDWPINIVVTPEAVESYGRVSQLLLKLKRATWSLEQCFYRIKRMQCIEEFGIGRTLHAMRHEICHTLCSVTQFIGSQILDVAYDAFFDQIQNDVKSLDDLYDAHQHYLHDLISKCLLNPKASAVQAALQDLISSAIRFDQELRSPLLMGQDEQIISATQVQSAEAVFKEFREQAAFLYRVVKKLSARGFHSHLVDLMATINFNGFYDK